MTISLTAHIQCRHFADVHKDNKHKSPLIKQFTDGYTADVVPRLLRITYCSCQTLPINFYPSKAAPRAASGGAKCTKLKLHQRVFSLFFKRMWSISCSFHCIAETIWCVEWGSTYCDASFSRTGTLLEFTSFTVSSRGYGCVLPVNCRP